MADIEKVMEGLRRCSCNVPDACSDCPYDSLPPRICVAHLTKDALELLKKQEPVKVADGRPRCRFECGNCGTEFAFIYNYCPSCGRKVKWDD